MINVDKEQGDLLLRLLAREHLCLREEGGDREEIFRIKELMREIVRGVYGVESIPRKGKKP
jgi:hypothetical protein